MIEWLVLMIHFTPHHGNHPQDISHFDQQLSWQLTSDQQLSWLLILLTHLSCVLTSVVTRPHIMTYSSYTELGFQINNLRFAVRIPSVKIRRPRFWRKKMSVNNEENITSSSFPSPSSSSISSPTSAFSSPTASSDDWIAEFHARYNPIHTVPTTTTTMMSDNQSPCLTSTPVTINRERRTIIHDVSGVKIYEDMDEIGDLFEDSSYDSYEIVEVENNTVIGRATFGTLKSCGTLTSRIL